jgi:hypothetical protein
MGNVLMAVRGALITKSADQTGLNITGGFFPTFNTVVYDPQSIVGSNQFFTIPAAYNGKYGILTLNLCFSSTTQGDSYHFWTPKNSGGVLFTGIDWNGVAQNGITVRGNGQATTQAWFSLATAPFLLTTSDRYEGVGQCLTDTSVTLKQESTLGLVVLDTFSYGYCLAKMSGDLTGQNFSTPTVISWNGTDALDTNGLHDPNSNPSKFIVPSSLNNTYMVFGCNVWCQNVTATSEFAVAITKNGSVTYTGFGGSSVTSGTAAGASNGAACCQTQAILVATGDQFETLLYCSDTSIDVIAARSNMWANALAAV